ncbi:ribosomal peptide maturation radical SAM protein 1 [Litoreibacter ponti]|uniref:Ribosomal peptide maturation radical SAM protein 1 n=1 Tax=Litoreibacter ponti TaxID=1510457 RepID=A0A2T6BEN4_9RHOB|nr:RiPP maturation radical SAM C-methyltransferase [Litoreibacter ponti]PTX54525.1 ribosomal peptide maturation radical SAM protein 1 [Litoreibacter ponti]
MRFDQASGDGPAGLSPARKLRTLLLSMPFGAVDRPALGISLLKAQLEARGFDCDISYPFEHLIARIGVEDYKWLTDEVPYTCFAGDWCFTLPLYGRRPDADWAYVDEILRGEWHMSAQDIRRIVAVREATPAFLEDCLAAYDWASYDVVGLTSTFVQNLSSLALAQRLKAAHPHLKIVFGGANWEDDMGAALFECFPFVDHVCRGEADKSFPDLIAALSDGKTAPAIAGVLSRGAHGLPAVPVTELDNLPYPDFSDYFEMHQNTAPDQTPVLMMETSRGCWWGAKHHCTFCGLNGQGMGFRAKSPDRALAELRHLTESYDVPLVSMVDNIIDMQYFGSFLSELAREPSPPALFYETKSNLSRSQVKGLALANVQTIQPGIENLSDRVLKLMRKGTTALRNIQLLKWCRELGVSAEWNILYGFPGETDDDYAQTLAWLPDLVHLQPPSGGGPVRIDRFSPYYQTPDAFGLKNLRAMRVFAHLYPFEDEMQQRISCYFEVDYEASQASPELVHELMTGITQWRETKRGSLSVHDTGQSLKIYDTRAGRSPRKLTLSGKERLIYLACDRVASASLVCETLARHGVGAFKRADVEAYLRTLVDSGLMIEKDGSYLALGIYDKFPVGWDEAVSHEEIAAE